jgi:hypothetical protein
MTTPEEYTEMFRQMNEHFNKEMTAAKAEHKAQIDQLSQNVAALADQNSHPSPRTRSFFSQ